MSDSDAQEQPPETAADLRLKRQQEARAAFLKRGMESLAEYQRTGIAYPAEEVFAELRRRLEARRKELLG